MATKTKTKTAAKPSTKKTVSKTREYVPTPEKDPGFDEFAQEGQFAEVVSGEYTGRYGIVQQITGDEVVFKTRDDDDARLIVKFSDLRPSRAGKR